MLQRLSLFALLLAAVSLACGGGTPSRCEQPPLPAASASASLSSNGSALPSWAMGIQTGGLDVTIGDPARPFPQIPKPSSWFASASTTPPDGGLMLCRFVLPRDGTRRVSVGPLDNLLVRASDSTFPPDEMVVSLPAIRLSAGQAVRVRGAVERSDCSRLDPFWVLTTGLPIPDCQSRTSKPIDLTLTWSTNAVGRGVECRAVPRARALEQADSTLSALNSTLEAMCEQALARPYDPAQWKMQADAAAGFLHDAAAWVGWADPAVVDGVSRYTALGGASR